LIQPVLPVPADFLTSSALPHFLRLFPISKFPTLNASTCTAAPISHHSCPGPMAATQDDIAQ